MRWLHEVSLLRIGPRSSPRWRSRSTRVPTRAPPSSTGTSRHPTRIHSSWSASARRARPCPTRPATSGSPTSERGPPPISRRPRRWRRPRPHPASAGGGCRRDPITALVDSATLAVLALVFGGQVGAFSGFPKGYDAWGHIAKVHLILEHWPYVDWNDAWYAGIPHFEGSYPPLYHLLVAGLVTITGRSIGDAMNLVTAGCVVGTVVATYTLVRTLTRRRLPALAAGLLVVGTPAFWVAFVQGGLYPRLLTFTFLAIGAWRTAAWAVHGGAARFAVAALATALALSSHLLVGVLALGVSAAVALCRVVPDPQGVRACRRDRRRVVRARGVLLRAVRAAPPPADGDHAGLPARAVVHDLRRSRPVQRRPRGHAARAVHPRGRRDGVRVQPGAFAVPALDPQRRRGPALTGGRLARHPPPGELRARSRPRRHRAAASSRARGPRGRGPRARGRGVPLLRDRRAPRFDVLLRGAGPGRRDAVRRLVPALRVHARARRRRDDDRWPRLGAPRDRSRRRHHRGRGRLPDRAARVADLRRTLDARDPASPSRERAAPQLPHRRRVGRRDARR